jgi:hypothetical protein
MPNQIKNANATNCHAFERKRQRREDSNRVHDRNKQNHFDRPDVVEKQIAVSPIFCQQLVLIDRHNYWGEGSILVGVDKMVEPSSFCNPTGIDSLNTEVLFDISAAEDALQIVFQECFLGDPENCKEFSAMDSHLKKTPTKAMDIAQTKVDELTRLTSTNRIDLEKLTTKTFLKQRAVFLKETYPHIRRFPEK